MTRIPRVIPAILTDDPEALERMIRQAESFTTYVQIDVMDGHFVPSRSISNDDLSTLSIKLDWEAHLMVQHPEDYLEGFKKVGAEKIIFHYEATSSPRDVIARARGLGLKVGLAVNPETGIPSLLPLVSEIDSVLLLTVNPGFYGSQFIPEVLDKAVQLRRSQPAIEIGVDGGIKESNIARVAAVGVDDIYAGSAIFLQSEPGKSFRRLQALAEEGSRHRKAEQ